MANTVRLVRSTAGLLRSGIGRYNALLPPPKGKEARGPSSTANRSNQEVEFSTRSTGSGGLYAKCKEEVKSECPAPCRPCQKKPPPPCPPSPRPPQPERCPPPKPASKPGDCPAACPKPKKPTCPKQ
ncbi:hypothetical protein AAG570_008488 [Ranatra chinensis]|uniref:Uncharacterized protein n=1 Tax=Ranatra chinensis TaxID=642074 RepID=A0ABD0YT84_9HEMI